MKHNPNALKENEIWDWQHPYECTVCSAIIYSKQWGDFTVCKCPGMERCFVDQTPYYGRYSGTLRRLELEEVEKIGLTIKEWKHYE